MRRVVTGGDLSQNAMRPPDLLQSYLELVERDVRDLGLLAHPGVDRPCPACGRAGTKAFRRLGFVYRECRHCRSLFVSPVPDAERLARYHHDGHAEGFWREHVLPATAEVRTRHALEPRVRWVAGTAAARLGDALMAWTMGDRAEALSAALLAARVFRRCAVAPDKGHAAAGDVVVAFEVLERAPDIHVTLLQCRSLLRARGLLFVSTVSGRGFEVRLLGGRMPSLVPPVHLQLLSRAGWEQALARAGFVLEEYSTPGELDVQAVADACRQDPSVTLPPVIEELVRESDEEVAHAFQELLQQAGLSAHVQFVAAATGQKSE